MRLLQKWSRISITATIIIFLVAAGALFISLRFILIDQIDDDLGIEESEIKIFVSKHGHLPETVSLEDQQIEFAPSGRAGSRHFETKDLIEPNGKEVEKYRQLIFFISDQTGGHRVTVSKSLEQTDQLIRSIFTITLITILLILLVSAMINRWAVKRLWRPFYTALQAVRDHKLSSGRKLHLPNTSIDEFRMMNESLVSFAGHAQLEYLSLKTFSENATHELQTPIAVIRSKLDLLLQEEHLSDSGADALQAAFNALERLGRLNHSLLLLARIENQQFSETTTINLKALIEEKIGEFQELFQQPGNTIYATLENVSIVMNEPLCHVLLNNLFSNALRHGKVGGQVAIVLDAGSLRIGNQARNGELDRSSLFRRFVPAAADAESNGLGLALVHEICRVSGFETHYYFRNDSHWFKVCFIREI